MSLQEFVESTRVRFMVPRIIFVIESGDSRSQLMIRLKHVLKFTMAARREEHNYFPCGDKAVERLVVFGRYGIQSAVGNEFRDRGLVYGSKVLHVYAR